MKEHDFIKWTVAGVFFFLFSTGNLQAQEIHPGDVNNNGIVNGVDLLYLGTVYGYTGPARSDEGTDWEPYTFAPWSGSFSNGLNHAYGDCDGDGVIDDEDIIEGISDNWGQVHSTLQADGFQNGTAGNDPVLMLQPSQTIVEPGSTINIDLILGNVAQPISDFYGMAIQFSFDAEHLDEPEDMAFQLAPNSWIDPTNGALSRTLSVFDDQGNGEIAIVRINQQNTGGYGPIGGFSMVIEDDIASLEIDTIRISIDSIILTGNNFDTKAITPSQTSIIVTTDPALLSSVSPIVKRENLAIFPNLVSDRADVFADAPIESLYLIKPNGKKLAISHSKGQNNSASIDLPDSLPAGLYFVVATTKEKTLTGKLIKN